MNLDYFQVLTDAFGTNTAMNQKQLMYLLVNSNNNGGLESKIQGFNGMIFGILFVESFEIRAIFELIKLYINFDFFKNF